MRRLFGYWSLYRKEAILCPAFKLIEAIFELMVPLIVREIIDVGIPGGDVSFLYRKGGLLLLLSIVGLGLALIAQYFASRASQEIGTHLRNELFTQINALSTAQQAQFGVSSLINRLTNDINQLQLAVAMLLRIGIRVVFLIVGASVMAWLIDAKMFLIFLVTGVVVSAILYWITSKSLPLYRNVQKKLDQIGLLTMEHLEGVRVIRAFDRVEQEQQRFDAANHRHEQAATGAFRLTALLTPLTSLTMNLGIIAILWIGGGQVQEGNLLTGDIVALVNYVTQILLALVVLAGLVVLTSKASACAERVYEVLDLTPEIPAGAPDGGAIPHSNTDSPLVELNNVTFYYDRSPTLDEQPALKDLSLTIWRGQTVGIIGATGSGKSTLVQLLTRLYDPSDGTVLFAGMDLKTLSPDALRAEIGLVAQQDRLLHDTVEHNLRLGNKNASAQTLERALQMADASEFASRLPQGLQTIVAENATNLSGGQRQRLAIARALVREPNLLLLDDSFSALDFATERRVRRAILAEAKDAGRTVVMISQRVGAVREADVIFVLHQGSLVGTGTHESLLQTCQIYREICQSQETAG